LGTNTPLTASAVNTPSAVMRNEDYELEAYNGMLSYLFEWGVDSSLDTLLFDKLNLKLPFPPPSFALLSNHGKVTLRFPM